MKALTRTSNALRALRACRAATVVVMAAAACARVPPATPAPAAPIPFAVVTWNMHAGAGDLPRLVDDLTGGRLAGAPVVDYVLLLQEAIAGGRHDVTVLAAARRLAVFYSPVRQTGGGVSGNALLSTLPLVEPRAIALPRQRQPRGAIATTIDVGGRPVVVVDAHLENRVSWWRGGLLSDTARGRQVDALLRALPATGSAIVGGDFNTWLGPTEPAWRRLRQRFPRTREPNRPTFHDRLVLDHLFVDVPDDWAVRQFVAPEAYDSDHHPVVALVTPSPTRAD